MRAELTPPRCADRDPDPDRRLLDFIADGNDSPSTAAKIKEGEDHADLQRATIARLESVARSVPTIPSVVKLRDFLAGPSRKWCCVSPVEVRETLGGC